MTKVIPLTQGLFTLVDDDVFVWASKFKWHASRQRDAFYAGRKVWDRGRDRPLSLHRAIMGEPDGYEVDHLNGDTLDNRRTNLRIATVSQNQHNRRGAPKNSKTGVRGVTWHKRDKCFRTNIQICKKRMTVGSFKTLLEASNAIDEARKRLCPDGIAS